jgi:hypothetical protein
MCCSVTSLVLGSIRENGMSGIVTHPPPPAEPMHPPSPSTDARHLAAGLPEDPHRPFGGCHESR